MKARGALLVAVVVAGCSASRIENGVFYSPRGYQLSLPGNGWSVLPGGPAELELQRKNPDGGMLADATCGGPTAGRPLAVLTRHLTFGLGHRETIETVQSEVGGRQVERTVVRGTADGADVAVEAVVLKDKRCVYDFVYVAPAGAFESGREDFHAFVESFTGARR
jgi:hypothetical protein